MPFMKIQPITLHKNNLQDPPPFVQFAPYYDQNTIIPPTTLTQSFGFNHTMLSPISHTQQIRQSSSTISTQHQGGRPVVISNLAQTLPPPPLAPFTPIKDHIDVNTVYYVQGFQTVNLPPQEPRQDIKVG